jgi:amino acid adenylation domain-containing protein
MALDGQYGGVAAIADMESARTPPPGYGLSSIQEGMLFHSRLHHGSGFDIEQLVCSLPEDIDSDALVWAAEEMVRRHDVFRTSFVSLNASAPLQMVHAAAELAFLIDDLRGFPPHVQQQQVERYLEDDRRAGFAMDRAPITRFALFRLSELLYTLVWTFHHALLDGRSFPTILTELFALYEARRSGQELRLPPPRPYREFIEWVEQRDAAGSEAYWRETLQGFRQATPLVALDGAGEQAGHGEDEIRLPLDTTNTLRQLAAREGFTLNTVVQGAWALILSRYSNTADVVLGVTRACRSSFPDAASVVGVFINTVPLRVAAPSEAKLFTWLQQIRASQLTVRDHELAPLTSIQAWSQVPRGTPLFESIIVFDNYLLNSRMRTGGGAWAHREVHLRERTNFPLALYGYGEPELILRLSYDGRRFNAASIRRTLGHLRTLLTAMAEDRNQPLAELPLLTAEEQHQILVEWNETAVDYPREKRINDLIEEQVQRTPDAVAVIFRDVRVTYRELNTRANRLAHHLEQAGVKPGDRVAICLHRSLDLVVALLAIHKAGGAYVPLDPAYPAERIQYVLSDAQVSAIVTEESLRALVADAGVRILAVDSDAALIQSESGDDLSRAFPSESVAYMIYTSGSTGKPKGVLVSHRNVVNFFAGMDQTIGRDGPGVWLAVTSISFDISVLELFWTLARGFRIVLQDENSESIPEQITRHRVTHLQSTPSLARMLLDLPGGRAAIGSLRTLLVGGEALSPAVAAKLRGTGVGQIFNMYGPTETTIWSTMDPLRAPGDITIGRPIANTSLFVLDPHQHPVPVGVPGELYIAGDGVTPGYWNRPQLTAERFVELVALRAYRTGDLVKYLPDGRVDFLGRLDHQVKIRGHRIELGEIEAALAQHPDIKESVVTAADDRTGAKILAAHIVTRNGDALPPTTLRQFLAASLPAYMIPAAFTFFKSFPLTPNGKIDRAALAATKPTQTPPEAAPALPTGDIERRLVAIWEDLLDTRPIGAHHNFFELGGHSLLIARLGNRIEQEFGKQLSMAEVFQTPTIQGMAALLRKTGLAPAECKVFPIQPDGSRPAFICLGAGPFFLPLAQAIGHDRPFCGLDMESLRPNRLSAPYRLEEIAIHVKKAIREFQPRGPYFLGGWCLAGVLMYEAARQMLAEGDDVALLVMIDSPNRTYEERLTALGRVDARAQKFRFHLHEMGRTGARKIPDFLRLQISIARLQAHVRQDQKEASRGVPVAAAGQDFDWAFQIASRNYDPPRYNGRVVMLQTTARPSGRHWDLGNRWRHLIERLEVIDVPAGHHQMFHEPHVQVLAEQLKDRLNTRQ